jgi:hypothetical protein
VEEFPQAAVDYVADVVKVLAEDLAKYDLSSRSANHLRERRRSAGASRQRRPVGPVRCYVPVIEGCTDASPCSITKEVEPRFADVEPTRAPLLATTG